LLQKNVRVVRLLFHYRRRTWHGHLKTKRALETVERNWRILLLLEVQLTSASVSRHHDTCIMSHKAEHYTVAVTSHGLVSPIGIQTSCVPCSKVCESLTPAGKSLSLPPVHDDPGQVRQASIKSSKFKVHSRDIRNTRHKCYEKVPSNVTHAHHSSYQIKNKNAQPSVNAIPISLSTWQP
jgi:hypothetical protein